MGRQLEAKSFPARVMSLSADGMDQFKTHLPSYSFRDKDTEDGRVQVHITGQLQTRTLDVHDDFDRSYDHFQFGKC